MNIQCRDLRQAGEVVENVWFGAKRASANVGGVEKQNFCLEIGRTRRHRPRAGYVYRIGNVGSFWEIFWRYS